MSVTCSVLTHQCVTPACVSVVRAMKVCTATLLLTSVHTTAQVMAPATYSLVPAPVWRDTEVYFDCFKTKLCQAVRMLIVDFLPWC